MARGNKSKEIILTAIKELFPKSFMDNKTLRIPIHEDGELIEIKLTLTAAKDTLGGSEIASATNVNSSSSESDIPTEEEINEVKELLKQLGYY